MELFLRGDRVVWVFKDGSTGRGRCATDSVGGEVLVAVDPLQSSHPDLGGVEVHHVICCKTTWLQRVPAVVSP